MTASGGASVGAAGLGGELRDARLRQGWELPMLSDSLRIRQSYLEAIEEGRVAELPGKTYALGFVRAYATALGLPGEDMARRFRAEAMQVDDKPTLSFPSPVPQRGVPAGAVVLLGLVILAGAYGGWYWITEHHATPVETVPPIPDRLATNMPAKAAPSPQVASLLPSIAPPAQRPAAPAIPPPPTQTQTALHAPTPAPTPAPLPETVAKPVQLAPAAAAPVAVPAVGARIVIKATADAWVTVKQKAGPALLNKLMHAGDTWPVPADKADLTITTGNAGGTELEIDGAPIATPLGASGMVRRDLPLDADMLKSGHLPTPSRSRAKNPVAQEG